MLHSRHLPALVPSPPNRRRAEYLTVSRSALLASFVLLALVPSTAEAQSRSASDTPLHVAANRFEFVASGDPQPPTQSIAVHNGGSVRLTDVRLTRLAYADSSRGAAWLVVMPRQSTVAPNELATVGTLCVDAAGLPAGTYLATAAVVAQEAPEPVAITITLVVTNAGALARQEAARHEAARHASARCGSGVTK